MRKLLSYLVFALAVALALTASSAHAQQPATHKPTAEQTASHDAETWLAMLDSGDYAESWKKAAAPVRNAVTLDKWDATLKSTLEPFGKLQTRKLATAKYTTLLPGAPDGDYVVVLYQSSFEHKQTAQETVIMSLEKDRVWRVAGFYVK